MSGDRSNIQLVGNTTQGQNLGTGEGLIFKEKILGNTLLFRSLKEGANIKIIQNGDEIVISGASGGEGGGVTQIDTNNGITGGPITTTGTVGLTGQALALHNLDTSGLIARTGAGTVAGRTITQGTGINVTNGDGVSANPTITLANTAVTPGTYGSATHVGQFTVDQQGRITAASSVEITGSGGASTFTGLTDTPANYTGSANCYVRVNGDANALIFVDPPTAAAGGNSMQIQYNDEGELDGSVFFYDNSTKSFGINTEPETNIPLKVSSRFSYMTDHKIMELGFGQENYPPPEFNLSDCYILNPLITFNAVGGGGQIELNNFFDSTGGVTIGFANPDYNLGICISSSVISFENHRANNPNTSHLEDGGSLVRFKDHPSFADGMYLYVDGQFQSITSEATPLDPYADLTTGAVVEWDASTGLNKRLTRGGDFTLEMTNLQNGMSGDLRMVITQNNTTITLDTGATNRGSGSIEDLLEGVYHFAWIYDGSNFDWNIALYE